MVANTASLTSKGQVTIPNAIRRALDLQAGDQLLFVQEGDRAVLIPVRRRPLAELFGALPATRPYPGDDEVRQEVRRDLGQRIARGEE